jgi:hypothetical protein
LPSWKIQTSAPNDAVSESSVMTTALIGIAIEPKRKKRISAMARSVVPTAHGSRSDWLTRKSSPIAADPPIWTLSIPAIGGSARTRVITAVPAGAVDLKGLIASSRTVEPLMYAFFRRAIPASRSGGRLPAGAP